MKLYRIILRIKDLGYWISKNRGIKIQYFIILNLVNLYDNAGMEKPC